MLQKTMGKNKETQKNKNVFKVATVRSIKLKAKAQKIINSKKIDSKGNKISNKDKTANMDRLLQELRKDVQVLDSKAKQSKAIEKKTIKNTKPLMSKVTPAQMIATVLKMKQIQL
ncbi:uncharacterized protein LOC114945336 [Nylanderia fulva]|uniref:uncharacterized protein LOC114945336 n=1 Tax=Nylanderia fulva TaxID=613905 RepID=UPI0010FADAD5|nr:uncharacterized protein LOC114945336 [Nylanderia fulva]